MQARQSSLTEVDGLHRDGGRILAVALLVELHHRLARGRRVERVEAAHVGAELLDGAGAKRVARGDQDPQAVLHQPEGDLRGRGTGGG